MSNLESVDLRFSQIVKEAQINHSTRNYILRASERRLPQLDKISNVMAILRPLCHFTVDSFLFHADNQQSVRRFVDYAQQNGWQAEYLRPKVVGITTKITESIGVTGLPKNTYVATLFPDFNWEIVDGHGVLLIRALRNMIKKFGKHALPYKLPVFRDVQGYVSDVESAAVVLPGNIISTPIDPDVQPEVLKTHTVLTSVTHTLPEGAPPQKILEIAPIYIKNPARIDGGKLRMHMDSLYNDITVSFIRSLPIIIKNCSKEYNLLATPEIVQHYADLLLSL